jgi:glutamine amidotransferase
MSKVTVVDYGAGNLLSVVRALEHSGADIHITQQAADIAAASKLILPGVGAFGDCMKALQRLNVVEALRTYIRSDKPFLGICVGMQVMFEAGEEFGEHEGLGVIAGRVRRISGPGDRATLFKIPHIGWGKLISPPHADWQGTLLEPAIHSHDPSVYFVHSFVGHPAASEAILATVDYHGMALCAAVRKGNAVGVQFHPEKSAVLGLSMLKSFVTNC